MRPDRLRLGIVGCGDVAHRHYLPALASRADTVTIAGVHDPRRGAGEAVVSAVAAWSPETRVFDDLHEMLDTGGLDAVLDLTPAPRHGEVNRSTLEAGLACYSEKPIAGSLREADELIALATDRDVLFLCAPGSAMTNRIRWLRGLATSGRLGPATLAVAQFADPGPADWNEYTGDPAPFYREGVGPVFDHGVYRLHEMTTVLGSVRRVQAMGSIARPIRSVRGGPQAGRTFEVTTPDNVLINLEFESGALGQLLASFAASDTRAPWLEMHFADGSVSFGGKSWEMDAPVEIHDGSGNGREGWRRVNDLPPDEYGTVEAGVRHFISCLLGEETPTLTAEHARHVLDIILKAYASIADGGSHLTETRLE